MQGSSSSSTTPCYVARARVRQAAAPVHQGTFRTDLLANGYPERSSHQQQPQPQLRSYQQQQQQYGYQQKTRAKPIPPPKPSKPQVSPVKSSSMATKPISVPKADKSQPQEQTSSSTRLAGVHPAHFYNSGGRGGSYHLQQLQSSAPPPPPPSTQQNATSASSGGVVMRRPKNLEQVSSKAKQYPTQQQIPSSSSSRRHGMYLPSSRASLAVMSHTALEDTVQSVVGEAKPPLPPPPSSSSSSGGDGSSQQPRIPPRTRPKSWTSSLFNAMRANHKSVNFQSVLEEQNHDGLEGSKYTSQPQSASSSGDCLHTLSVFAREDSAAEDGGSSSAGSSIAPAAPQLKLPKPCSRTPSPFRAIIKGLVKGINI